MANNIEDMMNKFSDMMGNSSSASHSEVKCENSKETFDTSKISPEMLKNFSSMFGSSNNSSSSIDMETILKLKNFMDQMNRKDSPDSHLLASLRPYLKESRKNKVDQYINLLNMSKAMNLFGNFRGW